MAKGRAISIILIIFGLYLIVSLSKNILDLVKKGEEIEKENVKVENLRQENEQLKEKIKQASTLEFIEREAREKLGMAREGEEVVVLPQGLEEKTLTSEEKENQEKFPNFKKWYKLFF